MLFSDNTAGFIAAVAMFILGYMLGSGKVIEKEKHHDKKRAIK